MVYTVYIDEVFAVNMAMDLMVLAAVNQVLCYRAGAVQIVRGAALGAVWSCVTAIFPQMPLIFKAAGTYGAAGAAMAVTAFGVKGIKEIGQAAAGIYLAAVILGGAMMVFEEQMQPGGLFFRLSCVLRVLGIPDLSGLLMIVGGAAAVFGAACWIRGLTVSLLQKKALCRVTLRQGSRMYTAVGLIDTGNRLREPVSGRPVHVAVREVIEELSPKVRGVTYVPYRSVGGEGLLPAVTLDEIKVEQEGSCYTLMKPLVAVVKQPLSPTGEYEVLIQNADGGVRRQGNCGAEKQEEVR